VKIRSRVLGDIGRLVTDGPKESGEILTSNGSTGTLRRTTIAAYVEMIRSRTRCPAVLGTITLPHGSVDRYGRFALVIFTIRRSLA
jgi:hypothetical protein